MSKAHETLGIKQVIRLEWMQKTVDLLLAGLDSQSIRLELHEFLSNKKGSGDDAERGETSRTQVVNILMNIWVNPRDNLAVFRDALLEYVRKHPTTALVVHWAMISAAYPFWFNVAKQTGRLLALQDQVTQSQIAIRLKEQYGDRQSVSRYTRYVIRSFVAWGVLKDSKTKGCYQKSMPISFSDSKLVILVLEAALLASFENKGTLGLILNHPAFFPFQIPVVSGDLVSQASERIDVIRYGMDDQLLKLKSH